MIALLAALTLLGATPDMNRWAAESHMPNPTGNVQIVVSDACGLGCEADTSPPTIVISQRVLDSQTGYLDYQRIPMGQAALLHELGHVFDFEVLTYEDRMEFERMVDDTRDWWATPNAPGEKFAMAYQLCALYGPTMPGRWSRWTYGYRPGRKLYAQVCAWISAR